MGITSEVILVPGEPIWIWLRTNATLQTIQQRLADRGVPTEAIYPKSSDPTHLGAGNGCWVMLAEGQTLNDDLRQKLHFF